MPAPVARLMLGDVVDEMLLGSQNVVPHKAKKFGYEFLHEHLEDAIGHTLGV
jgi:NAD dependent epimerase/dehydratase family enzyme